MFVFLFELKVYLSQSHLQRFKPRNIRIGWLLPTIQHRFVVGSGHKGGIYQGKVSYSLIGQFTGLIGLIEVELRVGMTGLSGTWIFHTFQTFTFTCLTFISPYDLQVQ